MGLYLYDLVRLYAWLARLMRYVIAMGLSGDFTMLCPFFLFAFVLLTARHWGSMLVISDLAITDAWWFLTVIDVVIALVSVNLVLGLTSMFVTQVPSFLGTGTAIGKSFCILVCVLVHAFHWKSWVELRQVYSLITDLDRLLEHLIRRAIHVLTGWYAPESAAAEDRLWIAVKGHFVWNHSVGVSILCRTISALCRLLLLTHFHRLELLLHRLSGELFLSLKEGERWDCLRVSQHILWIVLAPHNLEQGMLREICCRCLCHRVSLLRIRCFKLELQLISSLLHRKRSFSRWYVSKYFLYSIIR